MHALIRQVATDRALKPRDVQVFCLLLGELSTSEFRPVKQMWLAKVLGVDKTTAMRSLRRLVSNGYLYRQPAMDGSPSLYCLAIR